MVILVASVVVHLRRTRPTERRRLLNNKTLERRLRNRISVRLLRVVRSVEHRQVIPLVRLLPVAEWTWARRPVVRSTERRLVVERLVNMARRLNLTSVSLPVVVSISSREWADRCSPTEWLDLAECPRCPASVVSRSHG